MRIKNGFAMALSPQGAPNLALLDVVLYDCGGQQRAWIHVQHDDMPKGKEDANAVLEDALESNVQRALGALVLKLASERQFLSDALGSIATPYGQTFPLNPLVIVSTRLPLATS